MKAMLQLILCLLVSKFVLAQSPNEIVISFPDVVKSHNDCLLKINVYRNDYSKFVFPKKFTIGEMSDNVDLIYNIEKFDKGKYNSYRCSQSPLAMPGFPLYDIELKEYDSLTIIDSLDRFVCLEKGQYRIQILYNNRGTSGMELPLIQAKSNWITFKVEADKVLLGYLKDIQERKN